MTTRQIGSEASSPRLNQYAIFYTSVPNISVSWWYDSRDGNLNDELDTKQNINYVIFQPKKVTFPSLIVLWKFAQFRILVREEYNLISLALNVLDEFFNITSSHILASSDITPLAIVVLALRMIGFLKKFNGDDFNNKMMMLSETCRTIINPLTFL